MVIPFVQEDMQHRICLYTAIFKQSIVFTSSFRSRCLIILKHMSCSKKLRLKHVGLKTYYCSRTSFPWWLRNKIEKKVKKRKITVHTCMLLYLEPEPRHRLRYWDNSVEAGNYMALHEHCKMDQNSDLNKASICYALIENS